jgi:hypothetical protein
VAIDCIGECIKVTTYSGITNVDGGRLENYIKTITVNYTGTDTSTNKKVATIVNIELTPPADAQFEDLVPYDDLDSAWAQVIINNYIPNVEAWLTKELNKQNRPSTKDPTDPPWRGA